jgi:DNA-binding beta-propeller fold protein YncE
MVMKRFVLALLFLSLSAISAEPALGDVIYFTDAANGGEIVRINSDGNGRTNLITNLGSPQGIAVDPVGGMMYWANPTAGTISRANLNGTGATTILNSGNGLGSPTYLFLDTGNNFIYWSDPANNAIGRARLDGSSPTSNLGLTSSPIRPYGISLDLVNGAVFFSDRNANSVDRILLSGGPPVQLAIGFVPGNVAYNPNDTNLYYTDTTNNRIWQIPGFGGSTPSTLAVAGAGANPIDLALDLAGNNLYWVDAGAGDIRVVPIAGGLSNTILSGLNAPMGIAFELSPTNVPEPASLMLLGLTAAGAAAYAWQRRGNANGQTVA